MRFSQKEIQLTHSKSTINQNYISTIYSEVEINQSKKTQLAEKKIKLKISSDNSSNLVAKIDSKLNKLELNSLYKKHETLSKKIAFLIKNVHLKLNTKTEIIEILNHQKIIENWCQLKLKLEKRYKGKYAEDYFRGIDNRIKNHDSLLQNFMELKGFGLLWFIPMGLYKSNTNYKYTRAIDNMVNNLSVFIDESYKLFSVNEKEVEFDISGSLSKEQKHNNKIKHYFENISKNKNTIFSVESYKGSCSYDIKTGLINQLKLEIKSSYGSSYKKIQSYNLIKSQY